MQQTQPLTRISYKFFCTNPSKLKVEFLRNSSTIFRSIHWRCSIQTAVLRNFAIFTGKQLWCDLFFNRVADLQASNCIKKRLQHRCFPVNICEIFRTPFLQNASGGCFCRQNRSKETKRYSKKRYSANIFVETQRSKETEVIIEFNESVF